MDTQITIDARPALPISLDSLWDIAANKRDNFSTVINSEFEENNIIAWVRKSKPGEYPLYVVVDSWIQKGETNRSVQLDRSSLKLTILVDPCRVHPLTYKAELNRQGRTFLGEHWEMQEAELREIVVYLIQGGSKPKFLQPKVSILEQIIGAVIPFIGNPPENKLIQEARPNHATTPNILGWGGLGMTAIYLLNGGTELFSDQPLIILTAIASPIIAVAISKRREIIESIPKQPLRTPRREYRVDSWHVSVPGAGENFDQFRQRLYDVVNDKEPNIEMNLELHQRLTPRGYEERERLVLIKGQTTFHIHIYQFGNDAFVGWESYLNWNRWVETVPISTTVRNSKKINYRSLTVGMYVPTDFDIIEADVLTETTHRIIIEEIKLFLKKR